MTRKKFINAKLKGYDELQKLRRMLAEKDK